PIGVTRERTQGMSAGAEGRVGQPAGGRRGAVLQALNRKPSGVRLASGRSPRSNGTEPFGERHSLSLWVKGAGPSSILTGTSPGLLFHPTSGEGCDITFSGKSGISEQLAAAVGRCGRATRRLQPGTGEARGNEDRDRTSKPLPSCTIPGPLSDRQAASGPSPEIKT